MLRNNYIQVYYPMNITLCELKPGYEQEPQKMRPGSKFNQNLTAIL